MSQSKVTNSIFLKQMLYPEFAEVRLEKFLTWDIDECEMETFRKHERTGRPLVDINFIEKIEVLENNVMTKIKLHYYIIYSFIIKKRIFFDNICNFYILQLFCNL